MELAGRARHRQGAFRIGVPALSRIANFDDLDPLAAEAGVDLQIIQPGTPLPADLDLVILPGCKSTTGELRFLRAQGWDIDILAHARRGGHVLGLCGGYQMLGQAVHDPDGIEGAVGTEKGLGLLQVETMMHPAKQTRPVEGLHPASGTSVRGYEIHIGSTDGQDRQRPFLQLGDRPEGAMDRSGRIVGSYVHGLFHNEPVRRAILSELAARTGRTLTFSNGVPSKEEQYDRLAALVRNHLDMNLISQLLGKGK